MEPAQESAWEQATGGLHPHLQYVLGGPYRGHISEMETDPEGYLERQRTVEAKVVQPESKEAPKRKKAKRGRRKSRKKSGRT